MPGLEQLLAQINGQVDTAKAAETSAMKQALAPGGYSKQEAFYAGLLGLAPLIAGLIKGGNQSLSKAAQAGAVGLGMYDKGIQDENEKEAARALLTAKEKSTERQKLEEQSFGIQKDIGREELRRETKKMFPSKGTNVNVNNVDFGDFSKQTKEEVDAADAVLYQIDDINDFLNKKFKAEVKEGENLGEVLLRKGSGFLPESDQRMLNAKLQRLRGYYTDQYIKGNPSAAEHKIVIEGILAGNLASLKTMFDNLQDIRKETSILTQRKIERAQNFTPETVSGALTNRPKIDPIGALKSNFDLTTEQGRNDYIAALNKVGR